VTDNNSEVAPSLEELWKRSRAGARAGAGFRFGSIDCLESLIASRMIPMSEQQAHHAKRVGRPGGTGKLPHDYLMNIWLTVEVARERIKAKTGRTPPVAQVCTSLARRGGLKWIVGGNIDAIAAAMARERKAPISDWRRFSRKRDGQFVQDQNGSIIVSHIMQHAASIRSRYVGANQRVRHDDAVREAWTNILCDMLGRPRPAPAPARYFPPRFWRAPN